MKKILSTKKLNLAQLKTLSHFEVDVVEFISITHIQNIKINELIDCAVFTSSNAVTSIFQKNKNSLHFFNTICCVGKKTAALLQSLGLKIYLQAENATELSQKIITDPSISKITFFCGNIKRPELPTQLKNHTILVKEIECYQTVLTPHQIDKNYDGVLFFSPSAVESYLKHPNNTSTIAFCIGNTTKAAATSSFKTIYTAEETTVEGVLKKVIFIFKQSIQPL